MATYDRLVFKLQAENEQLKRDLAKAQGQIRRFSKQTNSSLAQIKKMAGGAFLAFGGLAALRGGVTAIKESVDAIDKIGKASRRMGINSTALQEYQHAAMLASVNQEQLNKGLDTAIQRTGELANRTSSQLSLALKEYDLVLLENIKTSTSSAEAIDLMFEALRNETNAAQRAALAKDFFGKAGRKLIPIIDDQAMSLEDVRKEAHRLGVIYGEDLVEDAQDLSDALARTQKQIDTNWARMWIKLAPALEWGTSIIADMLETASENADAAGLIYDDLYYRIFEPDIKNMAKDELFELRKEYQALIQDGLKVNETLWENRKERYVPRVQMIDKRLRGLGLDPENPSGDDGEGETPDPNIMADGGIWNDPAKQLDPVSMNTALKEWGAAIMPTASSLGDHLADVLTQKPMAKSQKTMSATLASAATDFGFALKEGAKYSKKLRKLQNKLALGMAIASTAAGVTRAFELPFPMNWIQAAAVSAAGLMQIRTIRAQRSQAHAGLNYVPRDETFLLRQGERVIQPEANKDLTEFLDREDTGATFNFNISAIDGDGVKRFLMDNSDLVADAVMASRNERMTT